MLLQKGCTLSGFPSAQQYLAISNFPGTHFRCHSIEILPHEQLFLALEGRFPESSRGQITSKFH